MPATTGFFTLDVAREHAARTHLLCRAAAQRTHRRLVFSHLTLLELRGMTLRPSTELDTSRLHITSNSMGGKSHLYGVQDHLWTNRMERTVIDDLIDGVSVEQAVCQMARYTDQDSLTMIMDWLT